MPKDEAGNLNEAVKDTGQAPQEGSGAGKGAEGDAGTTGDKVITQAELDRQISLSHKKWEEQKKREIQEATIKAQRDAEEAALVEKGEFKTLFEKQQAELFEAKRILEENTYRESAREVLKAEGIEAFEEVFFANRGTIDNLGKLAKDFRKKFDAAVDAEVAKRLETGIRSPKGNSKPGGPLPDDTSGKVAFIKEFGLDAFEARLKKGA